MHEASKNYMLQVMKREHAQLSHEAHECTDSIPDLNQMVFAVQALGKFQSNKIELVFYKR